MLVFKQLPEKEREDYMVALRQEGLTLQKIGSMFGVSRERVRQITDSRVDLRFVRVGREAAYRADVDQLWSEIQEDYVNGFTYAELSAKYARPRIPLRDAVERNASSIDRALHIKNSKYFQGIPQKFTSEKMLATLVEVSQKGQPISASAYSELLKMDRSLPSLAIFAQRFGSWSKALRAAGFDVEVKGPRKDRRWTFERMLEVLLPLSEEFGRLPAVNTYNKLSASRDLPSNTLIRMRFREHVGLGKWSDIRLYLLCYEAGVDENDSRK